MICQMKYLILVSILFLTPEYAKTQRETRCKVLEALYDKHKDSPQRSDPKYANLVQRLTDWYNKNCK